MRQQQRLLLIGLAAIVIAGVMTLYAYRSVMARVSQVKGESTKVVVATKELPLGVLLTADDVKIAEVPTASVPQGALTDTAKAIGRGVIGRLAKNEVVLDNRLGAEKAGAGLPAMIPENMRAVSVQVNEVIAVAGFVSPGTRVDVLLTGTPTNATNDVMTTTVLENVEVLAAGQKIQPDAEGKPEKVPVITLLVSPQDAQKLTLASAQGKIQLSLRNPVDKDSGTLSPVHNASLYHVGPIVDPKAVVKRPAVLRKADPPPPPPEPFVVEVLRGGKRDVTKF
jgi:pilus assembly protein CpaB